MLERINTPQGDIVLDGNLGSLNKWKPSEAEFRTATESLTFQASQVRVRFHDILDGKVPLNDLGFEPIALLQLYAKIRGIYNGEITGLSLGLPIRKQAQTAEKQISGPSITDKTRKHFAAATSRAISPIGYLKNEVLGNYQYSKEAEELLRWAGGTCDFNKRNWKGVDENKLKQFLEGKTTDISPKKEELEFFDIDSIAYPGSYDRQSKPLDEILAAEQKAKEEKKQGHSGVAKKEKPADKQVSAKPKTEGKKERSPKIGKKDKLNNVGDKTKEKEFIKTKIDETIAQIEKVNPDLAKKIRDVFSSKNKDEIKKIQGKIGAKQDGIVGSETADKLKIYADKPQKESQTKPQPAQPKGPEHKPQTPPSGADKPGNGETPPKSKEKQTYFIPKIRIEKGIIKLIGADDNPLTNYQDIPGFDKDKLDQLKTYGKSFEKYNLLLEVFQIWAPAADKAIQGLWVKSIRKETIEKQRNLILSANQQLNEIKDNLLDGKINTQEDMDKAINEAMDIMVKFESSHNTAIGGNDMQQVRKVLLSDDYSLDKKTIDIYNLMRFKGISGNSETVKDKVAGHLLDSPEFQDINGVMTQIEQELISIGEEKSISENSIIYMIENLDKNKLVSRLNISDETAQTLIDQFRRSEQDQRKNSDYIRKELTNINEQRKTHGLKEMSFTTYIRLVTSSQIGLNLKHILLKDKIQKMSDRGGEDTYQGMYANMSGLGKTSNTDWITLSDDNMVYAIEAATTIALMAIPMGAGMAAGRLALGGTRMLAATRLGRPIAALAEYGEGAATGSNLLTRGISGSMRSGVKLGGFAGQTAVRAIPGYTAFTTTDNLLYRAESVGDITKGSFDYFEEEGVKWITMEAAFGVMGKLSSKIGQALSKPKWTQLSSYGVSSNILTKSTQGLINIGKTGTQAGAITGVNYGVEHLIFEGDRDWAWEEVFQAMVAIKMHSMIFKGTYDIVAKLKNGSVEIEPLQLASPAGKERVVTTTTEPSGKPIELGPVPFGEGHMAGVPTWNGEGYRPATKSDITPTPKNASYQNPSSNIGRTEPTRVTPEHEAMRAAEKAQEHKTKPKDEKQKAQTQASKDISGEPLKQDGIKNPDGSFTFLNPSDIQIFERNNPTWIKTRMPDNSMRFYDGTQVKNTSELPGKLIINNHEYTGELLDGKPHGSGRIKNIRTGKEESGTFENGKLIVRIINTHLLEEAKSSIEILNGNIRNGNIPTAQRVLRTAISNLQKMKNNLVEAQRKFDSTSNDNAKKPDITQERLDEISKEIGSTIKTIKPKSDILKKINVRGNIVVEYKNIERNTGNGEGVIFKEFSAALNNAPKDKTKGLKDLKRDTSNTYKITHEGGGTLFIGKASDGGYHSVIVNGNKTEYYSQKTGQEKVKIDQILSNIEYFNILQSL